MALHVVYDGPAALELDNRRGIVLERNQMASRVLFLFPYNIPQLDIYVPNRYIAAYKPQLAYPPVDEREEFLLLNHRWNVTEAWNLITIDRPLLAMPQEKVDAWYNANLKGNDLEIVWETVTVDGVERQSGKLPFSLVNIDKEYALSDAVNTEIPILFAHMQDDERETMIVIDGWNRVYKAFHTRSPLKAYVLTPEEDKYLRGVIRAKT